MTIPLTPGLLFYLTIIALGVSLVYHAYKKRKLRRYLDTFGDDIWLPVKAILKQELHPSDAGGKGSRFLHMNRLFFVWINPEDDFQYSFLSKPFFRNPAKRVKDKEFRIVIDRKNPNHYWIDLTSSTPTSSRENA